MSALGRRAAGWAAELPPGAFALVMATGIVSIAAGLLGLRAPAVALLAVNLAAYAILVVLLLARLWLYRERVRADFRDHARAPGFFTVVAGTCVLGAQIVVLAGWTAPATWLWGLGALAWAAFIYAFFFTMTLLPEKPPLEAALNGAWMLIVVSTQSVAVLGALLAPEFGSRGQEPVLAFSLLLFLLGCMFYVLLFSLILFRFLFLRIDPERMAPPYWINMGAVAITTLAGSLLMLRAGLWTFLAGILPFLQGFTLFFWATATWWIPLLVLLGAWRHVVRRVPLRYDTQYWSMVFPLGMYAVSTLRLIEATGWWFLLPLPRVVAAVALLAWGAAFVGLVRWMAAEVRVGVR
ncbi:MAG TPA: tellurite resistance/C4-dicarboxylate transporter family protein [Longimicrobiales bacterium]